MNCESTFDEILDLMKKYRQDRKLLMVVDNHRIGNALYKYIKGRMPDFDEEVRFVNWKTEDLWTIENIEAYYILIPIKYDGALLEKLQKMEIYPNVDFAYPSHPRIRVVNSVDYVDQFGNRIKGKLLGEATVCFEEKNATVCIGENVKFGKNVRIIVNDDAVLKIGDNVIFGNDFLFTLKKGANVSIGNDVKIGPWGSMMAGKNSHLSIGEKTNIGEMPWILTGANTSLEIGKDCLISRRTAIRTVDGHTIFDVKSGKNINSLLEENVKKTIRIGNHVWLCVNSVILHGADIGDGSVVGALSLVNKKIPNNCIVAGRPARITRTDIAWSRENSVEDIGAVPEEYVNLTNELE